MLVGKLSGTGSLNGTLSGTGSLRGTLSGGGVGHGIPSGGEPGQGLIKVSDADYDVKWMDILPEDTASGAVASFPDGADDLPMGVVVDIDPVQDLHGFDNPWPAGGGKNLAKPLESASVVKGITITPQSDGSVILNGTKTEDNLAIKITASYTTIAGQNQTCSIGSSIPSGIADYGFGGYQANKVINPSSSYANSGVQVYINEGTVLNNVRLYPQIEIGSTATAYAPYSNICPISGWTGAKVTRTGANVWDEEWEVGQYSTTTGEKAPSSVHIRCVNPIPVKPSKAYFFSTAGYNINMCFMDANMNFISNFNSVHDVERTTPSNCYFVVFNMAQAYGTTYNNNISINLPSSIHDYSSYQGQSVTIQLGQTVYGGTLNVTNGELVVNKAIVTFDGSSDESWIVDSLNRAYTQINAIKKESNYSQSMKCDKLRLVSNQSTVNDTDYSISGYYDVNTSYPNRNWVYLKLTNAYNTVASIREWLTANPITIVYSLATPITLTLSAVEMRSLLGDNNVFADTGDVSVTYKADIQKYIDKKISAAVAAMS